MSVNPDEMHEAELGELVDNGLTPEEEAVRDELAQRLHRLEDAVHRERTTRSDAERGGGPVLSFSMDDVAWATRECHRQRVSPLRVPDMLAALEYARIVDGYPLAKADVTQIGWLVEPDRNVHGQWRQVDVMVGGRLCPRVAEVDDRMRRWFEMVPAMDPVEAFVEFELIHPFVDGNGRTGSILYNALRGTLDAPLDAPWVPEWGPDPLDDMVADEWTLVRVVPDRSTAHA